MLLGICVIRLLCWDGATFYEIVGKVLRYDTDNWDLQGFCHVDPRHMPPSMHWYCELHTLTSRGVCSTNTEYTHVLCALAYAFAFNASVELNAVGNRLCVHVCVCVCACVCVRTYVINDKDHIFQNLITRSTYLCNVSLYTYITSYNINSIIMLIIIIMIIKIIILRLLLLLLLLLLLPLLLIQLLLLLPLLHFY